MTWGQLRLLEYNVDRYPDACSNLNAQVKNIVISFLSSHQISLQNQLIMSYCYTWKSLMSKTRVTSAIPLSKSALSGQRIVHQK